MAKGKTTKNDGKGEYTQEAPGAVPGQVTTADGKTYDVPTGKFKVVGLVSQYRNEILFGPEPVEVDPAKVNWTEEQWKEFFWDPNLKIVGQKKETVEPSSAGGALARPGEGEGGAGSGIASDEGETEK
jgi:hypothetical protein